MYLIQVYKQATEFNKQSNDWSGNEQDFGKIIEKTIDTESNMIEWLNDNYPKLYNVERNRWRFDQREDADTNETSSGLYLCDYDIYIYETKEYEGDLKT